jgi:N-acetylmuramoyl-L-alanine amidase
MMIKVNRTAVWAIVLAVVGVSVGLAIRFFPDSEPVYMSPSDNIRVVVDAGHGAPDGGAVGVNGTVEKDINLAIAKKLAEVLEGKNISVVMTREGDAGIQSDPNASIRQMKREDMNKRMEIMKESHADLFISIHMNSFQDKKSNGLHVFYAKNHPQMKELCDIVQAKMNSVTKAKMHVIQKADSRLFLMKNPPVPAILVECGFLSNAAEEKKLADEDYQARIAWAIADSVEKFYTGKTTPLQ